MLFKTKVCLTLSPLIIAFCFDVSSDWSIPCKQSNVNSEIPIRKFCDQILTKTVVLPMAHAHNDYWNEQPLFDALSNGFNFIEVDVHLIRSELFVSHMRPLFIDENKTLKKLYLDPLMAIFNHNQGAIYPNLKAPINIVIDIKSYSEKTYQNLKSILEPYHAMLSYYEEGKFFPGAVTLLLSGNRNVASVLKEDRSYLFIDGKIADLDKGYDPEIMPVISTRYAKILGPKILKEKIPKHCQIKLQELVRKTHKEGKLLRLWHSPEDELVWEFLLEQEVDILNTDELEALKAFLLQKYPVQNIALQINN